MPAGPSLGRYRLADLQAGHVGGTKKSPPNALSPSFPLADVHYGEGGGCPVQPARVQHHRLHLRPRGTDVSAGPLRSAGDAGWPWAGSRGSSSWPQLGRKGRGSAAVCSHAEPCLWRCPLGAGFRPCSARKRRVTARCFWWDLGQLFHPPSSCSALVPNSACRPSTAQQRGFLGISSPFISNPGKTSLLLNWTGQSGWKWQVWE